MLTERVTLRHSQAGGRAAVALREPRGEDELAIEGVDTACAIALVGRLLGECGLEPGKLAASDRDALLAALHRQCWGDRIVSTLTCAACASRFDLSFRLSDVQRHLASLAPQAHPFKVPRGEDELSAAEQGPREAVLRLAGMCGAGEDEIERASDALTASAPIVDLEIGARCVECGHEQSAHFDLQSFVLQRLLNERRALLSEVHQLAAAYGWSLGEILALPRSARRAMIQILDRVPRA